LMVTTTLAGPRLGSSVQSSSRKGRSAWATASYRLCAVTWAVCSTPCASQQETLHADPACSDWHRAEDSSIRFMFANARSSADQNLS
jgi:hypothetical protein